MRELRLRKEKQPLTAMGMQTRPHLCAALSEAMLDGKRKTNRPRKDRKWDYLVKDPPEKENQAE